MAGNRLRIIFVISALSALCVTVSSLPATRKSSSDQPLFPTSPTATTKQQRALSYRASQSDSRTRKGYFQSQEPHSRSDNEDNAIEAMVKPADKRDSTVSVTQPPVQRVRKTHQPLVSQQPKPVETKKDLQLLKEPPQKIYRDVLQNELKGTAESNGSKCSNENCWETVKDTICNCSFLKLDTVPSDLPVNVTILILANNSIISLSNGTLASYPYLRFLNLESNKLQRLEVDSFEGLSSLEVLNLRNNVIKMNNVNFPQGVFSHLGSLKVLLLQRNNENVSDPSLAYPTALGELASLEELHLDGLRDQPLGQSFQNLTLLSYLSFAGYTDGYCYLHSIKDDMFRHVAQIKTLRISNCYIHGHLIQTGVFLPLTKLESLDLAFNDWIGPVHLPRIMTGLKDSTTLKTLNISYVVSEFSKSITLNRSMVENFPDSLETIIAEGNAIEVVDLDVFPTLPKSLTRLYVGSNRFIFGTYLKGLTHLSNLKELSVTPVNTHHYIPMHYPSFPGPEQALNLLENDRRRTKLIPSMNMNILSNPLESSDPNNFKGPNENDDEFILNLPPNLKTVDINFAGMQYILSYLKANSSNALERLSISGNYFPSLDGPFIGFDKIKVFNLSRNSIEEVKQIFFQNMTSLVTLDLSRNWLKNALAQNSLHIHRLTNLQYLDLSFNQINIIQSDAFRGLNNLEVLIMSNNKFWDFNPKISHMKHLRILDLSYSEIGNLSKPVRDHIDTLRNISVNMSMDPIICNCGNLDFLKWMVRSDAIDTSDGQYKCVFSDGNGWVFINDHYEATLRMLEKQCHDNYLMFLLVVTATIVMAAVMIGGILYRFRWKLRYLYHVAFLSLNRKEDRSQDDGFLYDVFVSYSSEDIRFITKELIPELQKRGLKLHIHGRDFVAGRFIASNIVTAVSESRKTLVVLTRNLLESTWCNYELQMATMESVHTGRQVLVFLLKDSIPTSDLGHELLCHIRNNTYIPHPLAEQQQQQRQQRQQQQGTENGEALDEPIAESSSTEMSRQMQAALTAFWDKLAKDLKR